jgi:molybdopterin-guanine dinucleotide biosynthesis protein A
MSLENIHDTLAIVLAGGQGRRFGGDKTLADLAGRPIIAHVIDRLRAQGLTVAINANGPAGRYAFAECPVFDDGEFAGQGPLAGLLATMARAEASGCAAILTVSGDAPFLPMDLFARLAAAGAPAVAASGGRIHPVIGLWPVALAPTLRDMLTVEGIRRASTFAECVGARRVEWPVGAMDPFFDIDTPDDLVAAATFCRDHRT